MELTICRNQQPAVNSYFTAEKTLTMKDNQEQLSQRHNSGRGRGTLVVYFPQLRKPPVQSYIDLNRLVTH